MSKTLKNRADAVTTTDSNKVEYEELLPVIRKQETGNERIYGELPIILGDAGEKLYCRAIADRTALENIGLPVDTFDNLKKAPSALRTAQAILEQVMQYRSDWLVESPRGYKICNDLKCALLFACRENKVLTQRIVEMTKGKSKRALPQHLQNLNTFGEANRELLESINFDFTLLDLAAERSAHLANLLGASENEVYTSAKTIRDQAYVYLKHLMMEIRTYGQYLFHDDNRRLAEYTGSLMPKRTVRRKKAEPAEVEPALEITKAA